MNLQKIALEIITFFVMLFSVSKKNKKEHMSIFQKFKNKYINEQIIFTLFATVLYFYIFISIGFTFYMRNNAHNINHILNFFTLLLAVFAVGIMPYIKLCKFVFNKSDEIGVFLIYDIVAFSIVLYIYFDMINNDLTQFSGFLDILFIIFCLFVAFGMGIAFPIFFQLFLTLLIYVINFILLIILYICSKITKNDYDFVIDSDMVCEKIGVFLSNKFTVLGSAFLSYTAILIFYNYG